MGSTNKQQLSLSFPGFVYIPSVFDCTLFVKFYSSFLCFCFFVYLLPKIARRVVVKIALTTILQTPKATKRKQKSRENIFIKASFLRLREVSTAAVISK